MTIIKVKNIKTNFTFAKTTMWKIPKFHPTYWSKNLCKADSRNVCFAKSAGTIYRFPFFNPAFKNTKIRYVFVTIRKNVPNNWAKIGYTFGLVKYGPSNRSGKLRIKLQIVRVTTFFVKILLTTGGDSSLLTLYISLVVHWILLSWMETELSFSKSILKDDCLSLYIIRKHLSISFYFFICCAIVTHPYQWTIIELRIEKSIYNNASFR